ncbi:MAG: hypothetical protein EZS28_005786 [Streblomastix strix]|uniref:Protein kinase domain-containing protein n=1 Tax=Streblomastix strix TaxID=222440 RepID=A0A5J4WUI0_9EUKA|nr:MAG: hypothetical protein EZS28_005786 [Streblomastix strix]
MLYLVLNVVADFGLAQKTATKSYLRAAGTKNYAPYEAYTQNRMMTESDVWSIGVIIIEVITGEHPFEGQSQEETINNIKTGKFKPLPNYIQQEMKLILEKMINLDYTKRPTVKELLESETMQLVGMIEKSKEQKESEQKEFEQEKEQMNKKVNELEIKVRSLEIENQREKERADLAEQEKQKALSERYQEKRRTDTEHAQVIRLTDEVIRLTAEVTNLNQLLQSVPSSLRTITYQSIIPDSEHVKQQDNKIIRTNKGWRSTVTFNPAISSGIVRFGGFLEKHPTSNFSIGIADSSAFFGSNEGPHEGENGKKTVRYLKNGNLQHNEDYIKVNSPIEENKTVAMEVHLYDKNSSFTITQFENVLYSSAKGIRGQIIAEWGERWWD